ncbi:hypothetical protein GALLN_00182 [Gallionellaceae bacterium]|nr:hypothetical protein GALLN_00182 [Gallionellaceae bacterium]
MLEMDQQSRQPLNLHKPNTTGIGTGTKEMQHPRFQRLVNKMYARLTNADSEIDQEIFERFCERMLPVTFLNWMCKP